MKRFISTAGIVLLLSAPLHGCDSDDAPGEDDLRGNDGSGDEERVQVLVGELSNTDVKLGVISKGDKARLFFCGGETSVEDSTKWLVVEMDQNSAFEIDSGDWHLSGQLDGDRLSGELERTDDEEKGGDFLARLIDPDTAAGVYEGTDDQCGKVGLIVTQPTPDDEAAGQGACVGMDHPPQPVGVLLPIVVEGDGSIGVELEDAGKKRPASVIAALPP